MIRLNDLFAILKDVTKGNLTHKDGSKYTVSQMQTAVELCELLEELYAEGYKAGQVSTKDK